MAEGNLQTDDKNVDGRTNKDEQLLWNFSHVKQTIERESWAVYAWFGLSRPSQEDICNRRAKVRLEKRTFAPLSV